MFNLRKLLKALLSIAIIATSVIVMFLNIKEMVEADMMPNLVIDPSKSAKLKIATSNPSDWSSGLMGYWSFDGTAIQGLYATTTDLSSNGNNGTITGAVGSAGAIGQALRFDGIDDYVQMANSTSLNPSNITLEVWFNVTSGTLAAQKALIQKAYTSHNPPYYQYTLLLVDTAAWPKTASFRIAVGGALYSLTATGTAYGYGSWHHFVSTYDGETMYSYLDGAQIASTTSPSGNINSYSTVIQLAAYPNLAHNSTYSFSGLLDEVRIYNRALTTAEIQEHYTLSKRLLKF